MVTTGEPWRTLLEATGRLGEPEWRALDAPLADWDGAVPVGEAPPPAIAWSRDDDSRRWTPTSP